MKKNKDFDCVEMKNRIQAEILEEMKTYPSEKEYRDARLKELMSDPRWRQYINNTNNT